MRDLIEKIVLTPLGEPLKAERYGHLAEGLAFADPNPKSPTPRLLAGALNYRWLRAPL